MPFVERTLADSTHAAYSTYWKLYIKPWAGKYALRDFTTAIVASILKDATKAHKLNKSTVGKVRSIISGIFTYAISEGHFPAHSAAENPASRARIPEFATDPLEPKAATKDDVESLLAALQGMTLEQAAVAIHAAIGPRPGEARGLRWEEWDRAKQQIYITRGVWHAIVGTTKTPQSVRFVAVSAELREMLLAHWKEQGSPIRGYILAGPSGKPINLDNLVKRSIRPRIEKAGLTWPGWYSMRRLHGTAVRAESNLETTSRALGNSKAVADRHYVKPQEVLPDVRKAVNDANFGLTDVQRLYNGERN